MDEYLGTVKIFAFSFAPKYWTTCDGQTMSIAQNQALFALLGTTYGGDGVQTFRLPDLRGRSMVGAGPGGVFPAIMPGQASGVQSTTLTVNTMPAHIHTMVGARVTTVIHTTDGGTISNISDNGTNSLSSGGSTANAYSEPPMGTTDSLGGVTNTIGGSSAMTGGSMPFSILNPYLGMYHCICLSGLFPSRN